MSQKYDDDVITVFEVRHSTLHGKKVIRIRHQDALNEPDIVKILVEGGQVVTYIDEAGRDHVARQSGGTVNWYYVPRLA
jgi:hypothetical protein